MSKINLILNKRELYYSPYLLISVGEVFVKEIHGLEVLEEEALKLLELLRIRSVSSHTS